MKQLLALPAVCVMFIPAALMAQPPTLEHVANIQHDQVAGIPFVRPPEPPDVAFAVFRDASCRTAVSDSDAVSAIMTILREARLGGFGYLISYGEDMEHFRSAMGRFDLYCVPGSGPVRSVVAVLTTGSSDRSFWAFGLDRTDSGWEVSFVPQDRLVRLPGTGDYKMLGFLESSGVPWSFALLLDEGVNNNIEVIDLEGGEAYAGVGSAVLVREKEDLVLYVSAREWVSEPEHEVVRLRGPGWDQLWSERRISKTHQAKVVRRIDQAGAAIVDKVVYQTPPRDGKSPEDVGEFVRRVEERFKTFREQGLVVAE
jgi:hypothetical protein